MHNVPLQSNSEGQETGNEAHTSAGSASSHWDVSGTGRDGNTASANGNWLADNTSSRDLGLAGSLRLVGRDSASGSGSGRSDVDLRGVSSEANLGNGDLGGDSSDGGTGASSSDTRLSDSGSNDDGGVLGRGDDGSTGDGDDSGDGLSAGSNAGVLVDVGSADTLEEGDGLSDDVVALTVGVQALEDGFDVVLIRAVASSVSVVLALVNHVEEGVETAGNDTGARNSLLRAWGNSSGRSRATSGSGNSGSGDRGSRGTDRGGSRSRNNGLSDGAHSGGDRDGHGGENSRSMLGRAVSDLRLAAGDGLDGGRVDGRGGVIGGDHNSGGVNDSGAAASRAGGSAGKSARSSALTLRDGGGASRDGGS